MTMAHEVWIHQRIVGALPAQMSLPFALRTRRAIQALIKAQFSVELSDRLVGKYLARWGYTAQRTVKRAPGLRPERIDTRLRETCPAIAARWGKLSMISAITNRGEIGFQMGVK